MRDEISNATRTGIHNRRLILSIIRDEGPISRIQLSKRLGLTSAATTVIVRDLMAEGLVVEQGTGESKLVGRKPIHLIVNPNRPLVAGVRVRKGYCRTVVANLAGNAVSEMSRHFTGRRPEDVYREIEDQLHRLTGTAGIDSIKYICVATSGVFNIDDGIINYSATFDWHNVPFAAELSARLGIPVHLVHFTNAAAYAYLRATPPSNNNLIFINWSIGISSAMIVNGQIYRGSQGYAGELGHMSIAPLDGVPCTCGGKGCLETYCGMEAVMAKLHAAGSSLKLDLLDTNPESLSEEETAILIPIVKLMGTATANLINLFNPHQIIIAGEGVALARLLSDTFNAAVMDQVLPTLRPHVNVQLGEQDMAVHGAAALAGTYLINSLYNI